MAELPNSLFDPDQEVVPACWRAEIVSAADDEERRRYRVRILQLHPEDVPVTTLPYAELIGYGGKGFGDSGPYDVGDLVWVMFEGGDREYPVILGGWLSQSQGVPDLPPEVQEEYDTNRLRWMRVDKAGNVIEMSSVPGAERILVKSGGAQVELSKLDNGIVIASNEGPVQVNARRATVQADELQLEGGNTNLFANRQTPSADPEAAIPTPGTPSGVNQVFSNQAVNIYGGATPGTDALGLVRIGQYVDAAAVARQSGIVRLQPQLLELGVANPTDPTIPTLFVDAACTARMRLLAPLVVLGQEGFEDFLVKFTDFKAQFDTHTHGETGSTTTPPSAPLLPTASTANTKAS